MGSGVAPPGFAGQAASLFFRRPFLRDSASVISAQNCQMMLMFRCNSRTVFSIVWWSFLPQKRHLMKEQETSSPARPRGAFCSFYSLSCDPQQHSCIPVFHLLLCFHWRSQKIRAAPSKPGKHRRREVNKQISKRLFNRGIKRPTRWKNTPQSGFNWHFDNHKLSARGGVAEELKKRIYSLS